MARQFGFSYVSEEGFAAYDTELEGALWRRVPEPEPGKLLSDSPVLVVSKARLRMAVGAMVAASGVSNKVVLATRAWDRVQTRLSARITYDETDDDPEKSARASRMRELLLRGSGTGQTSLETDAKIDFGQAQVVKAESEALAGDIKTLGYEPLLKEVARTTHELAVVAGREGGGRPAARSVLMREARSVCVTAFNGVTDTLDYLLGQTPVNNSQHKLLTELRGSLQALLDRHPPTKETAPESADQPDTDGAEPARPVLPVNPSRSPFME